VIQADYIAVRALNAAGQFAGEFSSAGGDHHAFVFDGNRSITLGDPGHFAFSVAGLSSGGDVVGGFLFPGQDELYGSYLFRGGRFRPIGPVGRGGNRFIAEAVNSAGVVAGRMDTANGTEAFLYNDGALSPIGSLGGYLTMPHALNERGDVVGSAGLADWTTHAFLRADGKFSDLDTLGGNFSSAEAINEARQIVGYSYVSPRSSVQHACLWETGRLVDLGTLANGASSRATGINNRGEIVGVSDWGYNSLAAQVFNHGFIYVDGVMRDLDSLIDWPSGLGAHAIATIAINDKSEILAGVGSDWYIFRPIVERQSRITNFSVLAPVGSNDGQMVLGCVLSGQSRNLLVRAVGPGLAFFGVPNFAPSPALTVIREGLVGYNEGWSTCGAIAAMRAAFAAAGAFPLAEGSSDAALVLRADAGIWTCVVGSHTAAQGTVLAEIYDTYAGDDTRIANVSGRVRVPEHGTATAGFVISGEATKRILVRASGPALRRFGISEPIPNPHIALHDSVGNSLAEVEGWDLPPSPRYPDLPGNTFLSGLFSRVGAFGLSNQSADAAMVVAVRPGSYTVKVRDVNGAGGIALLEFYDLDQLDE